RDQVDRRRTHGVGVDPDAAGHGRAGMAARPGITRAGWRRLERIAAAADRLFHAIAERAELADHAIELFFRQKRIRPVLAKMQERRAIQIADGEIAGALFPVEAQATRAIEP